MSKFFIVKVADKNWKVKIKVNKYSSNGNLALDLITDNNEPFAVITKNLIKFESKTRACIDINNYPWARDFIEENELGVCIAQYIKSGFCEYPVYEFDLKKFK